MVKLSKGNYCLVKKKPSAYCKNINITVVSIQIQMGKLAF